MREIEKLPQCVICKFWKNECTRCELEIRKKGHVSTFCGPKTGASCPGFIASNRYCNNKELFPLEMAPKTNTTSTRSLFELFHPTRRRSTCANSNRFPRPKSSGFLRNVSTAAPQHSEMEVNNESRPRWSYTPTAMAAPVRSRLPRRDELWKVNEDPRLLDSTYVRFLGPEGDEMLTDETKWLAVTHKSFDHGRRGFNDRLSYIGGPEIARILRNSDSNFA